MSASVAVIGSWKRTPRWYRSRMGDDTSARTLRARLEHGEMAAADALAVLAASALDAATRSERLEACRLLGDLAGRALGAEWEVAERAAFALLEAARVADTAADRRGVIAAMGRGFRNIWLLPFVHRRLSDRDETIAAAALHAAGGLGFPALEEAVAAFVTDGVPAMLRRAAIGALGRMGAASAVDRLVAVARNGSVKRSDTGGDDSFGPWVMTARARCVPGSSTVRPRRQR